MTHLLLCARTRNIFVIKVSDSRTRDVTHSYLQHDSFITTPTNSSFPQSVSRTASWWRIYVCDMTHSYVQHTSFISATYARKQDVTNTSLFYPGLFCVIKRSLSSGFPCVWACLISTGLFELATWLIHTRKTFRIQTLDMTHSHMRISHVNESCHTWSIMQITQRIKAYK